VPTLNVGVFLTGVYCRVYVPQKETRGMIEVVDKGTLGVNQGGGGWATSVTSVFLFVNFLIFVSMFHGTKIAPFKLNCIHP